MENNFKFENQNTFDLLLIKPCKIDHLDWFHPDYTEQISNAVENGLELKKGQRHGEFHCRICNKYFKYVKPYIH